MENMDEVMGFDFEDLNKAVLIPEEIQTELSVTLTDDFKVIKVMKKRKESYDLNLGNFIYPTEYFVKSDGSLVVLFKYRRNNKWHEFVINAGLIGSIKFFEEASNVGALMPTNEEARKYLKELIMSLYNYMLDSKEPTKSVNQMGWFEKSFYLGNKKISKDGITNYAVPANRANYFNQFKEVGSYDKYKNATNTLFTEDAFFKHSIVYLQSMAVPLLRLLGHRGVTTIFHSEHSGNFKSGLQAFSQAAFSNPEIIIKTFTQNAIFGYAGSYGDLPLNLDEISDPIKETPQIVSDLIYHLTQGSTKSRANVDGGLRDVEHYYCSMFASTNTDIYPILDKSVAKSSRAYQLSLEREYTVFEVSKLKNAMYELSENYGWGFKYIEVIVKSQDEIKKQLRKLFEEFENKFEKSNFRYFSATFASSIVAAQIYQKMGFDVDAKKIYDFYINIEVPRIIEKLKESKITGQYILHEFLLENQREIKQVRKQGMKFIDFDSNAPQPLTYNCMMIPELDEIRINRSVFNKFLSKHKKISVSKWKDISSHFDIDKVRIVEKDCIMNGFSVPCLVFEMPRDYLGKATKDNGLKLVKYDEDDDKAIESLGK